MHITSLRHITIIVLLYCTQVGSILVAYHKDQGVKLEDVIKTAALLCREDYKPVGLVRQVISEQVISHSVLDISYRMLSTFYELLLNWNISATL